MSDDTTADLGIVQHRLGRKPGYQFFVGPVLVLWGGIFIWGRGISSPYGILGLVMVFMGIMLVAVSIGATVNVHQRGLTVRSSFFQTTRVHWSEVKELLPATSSLSSFRIVRHDDSIVLVDRLSLKPTFNRKDEPVPHKDAELVLKRFEQWKAAPTT